jgi:hypothetical protein
MSIAMQCDENLPNAGGTVSKTRFKVPKDQKAGSGASVFVGPSSTSKRKAFQPLSAGVRQQVTFEKKEA